MCEHNPDCEFHDKDGKLTEKGKELMLAQKKGFDNGMIKVHVTIDPSSGVSGETLWANPIGRFFAQIANIPFFCEIGMDDIVEIHKDKKSLYYEFIRVVHKNTNTYMAQYELADTDDKNSALWMAVKEHFYNRGMRCEGARPGVFAISVPVMYNQEYVREVASTCSHPVQLFLDENEEDTSESQENNSSSD